MSSGQAVTICTPTPLACWQSCFACPDENTAKATIISGGPFNGWSYYELIVEAIDLLKWCQGDGGYRGSWGYDLNQQQTRWDGSTQQWPIMVMKAAKERWGISVPQWVKDNSLNALAALRHSSKGIGYSNSSSTGGYDTGKTGGGLLGYKWAGLGDQSAEVLGALGYIQNTWLNGSTRGIESGGVGWNGQFIWYVCVEKGPRHCGGGHPHRERSSRENGRGIFPHGFWGFHQNCRPTLLLRIEAKSRVLDSVRMEVGAMVG